MADKLTRQKDILKSNLSSYLQTTTNSSYMAYFEGSPTYLVYYQLDNQATLQDGALETVHSLVGANTPNKYKRIYDLPVYGVDALDVQNEITERGLQAVVNGEILILPDSIRPYPGDFFEFAYDDLRGHLFRINDVQYDKLTPKKYFRCQYSLFQDNADEILANISEDYEATYNANGSDGTSSAIEIKKSSDVAEAEKCKNLVNSLIEKYTKLYYNDDMDTFVFYDGVNTAGTLINNNASKASGGGYYYWSPYLQHFLHETNALTSYTNEILTEIYINDINEIDNGNVYSEEAYRNSLFRNVEIQNSEVNFDTNFMCISDYELKMTRNLPFFMSPLNYRLITPIIKSSQNDLTAYMNSFPLLFGSTDILFKDIPHDHKVHELDELHLARIEPYIRSNDIIYECARHELEPTRICIATEVKDESGMTNLRIDDASIVELMDSSVELPDTPVMNLFKIIKGYLNGSFKLTEDVLTTLNNLYYKPSLQNYILVPIVVYILKEKISEM